MNALLCKAMGNDARAMAMALRSAPMVKAYDPDQPRDDGGKWTSGGGGGSDKGEGEGGAAPTERVLSFYNDPLNEALNTPGRRWPKLVAGRTSDYEVQMVDMGDLTPTQEGEDRLNDSSRRLAEIYRDVQNGKVESLDDINRAQDFDPIILDEKGRILDGNHRFTANEIIGSKKILALVPVGKGSGRIKNMREFFSKKKEAPPLLVERAAIHLLLQKTLVARLILEAFDPEQPRDDMGRWSSGPGALGISRRRELMGAQAEKTDLAVAPSGPGREAWVRHVEEVKQREKKRLDRLKEAKTAKEFREILTEAAESDPFYRAASQRTIQLAEKLDIELERLGKKEINEDQYRAAAEPLRTELEKAYQERDAIAREIDTAGPQAMRDSVKTPVALHINKIVASTSGAKKCANKAEKAIVGFVAGIEQTGEWPSYGSTVKRYADVSGMDAHGREIRAYCSGTWLTVGGWDVDRQAVHEFGHAFENQNPEIQKACRDFLRDRTKGETVQPLKKLTGSRGYKGDEVAKPDRFKSPYCGKIYSSGHTEILSMGFQQMHQNMVRFAHEDPEYFDFVWNVMRGKKP